MLTDEQKTFYEFIMFLAACALARDVIVLMIFSNKKGPMANAITP